MLAAWLCRYRDEKASVGKWATSAASGALASGWGQSETHHRADLTSRSWAAQRRRAGIETRRRPWERASIIIQPESCCIGS
jgi:hypothetical protein